jgi:hypothetical protein
MAWTDERMDDLASRMDAGFERTNHDIRDLRAEIRGTRTELKGDIAGLRTELKGDIADLRTELAALQALTMRFGIALLVALVGVIATLMGAIATGGLGG